MHNSSNSVMNKHKQLPEAIASNHKIYYANLQPGFIKKRKQAI